MELQCTHCKKVFYDQKEFDDDQVRHEQLIKKALKMWGNQGNPLNYIIQCGSILGPPSTPTELPIRCSFFRKEHDIEDYTYENNVGHTLPVKRCRRCKSERRLDAKEMDDYNRKNGTW